MKVNFILGRSGSGKTFYCLEEMRKSLLSSAEGPNLLMLLPEHATFKTEKMLAGMEGLGGFTRAYVFGFKRFAERVLLETGGALYPHIDDMGKKLLLAGILKKQKNNLPYFARAAGQRNFAGSLVKMIEECKAYAVTPEDLSAAADKVADTALKEKLRDLSLIYRAFTEKESARYHDGEDRLALLSQKIGDSAMVAQARVFVDGFSFFNPQEVAVLTELIKAAHTVTITLCLSEPDAPEHALETDVFHRQWKTFRQMCLVAEELGAKTEVTALPEIMRFCQGGLLHLEQNLYRFPLRKAQSPEGVNIVEAANRRLEVEAVAADILRLCREDGYRWRDIGVLVRDGESYHDLLREVFRDDEIEFFSEEKRLCLHHPLAELLRSALEARQGWRYEPMFRCFKTDFFAASRAQIDVLENYVLAFGIRGKRWLGEEDWTYRKTRSFDETEALGEAEAKELKETNTVRRLLTAPLFSFDEQLRQAKNAVELTKAVYDFLLLLDVPEKLARWAAAARQQGDLAKEREHWQIWDSIVKLMDRMVETCGEAEMSFAEFEAILNDGLEGLSLRLIPPGLDYVTIASFDQNSLDGLKAIYVVGVNEGALPKRGRGEGLLSDAERSAMAEAGVTLAGGVSADSFAERYLIYAGFTRSSSYLQLSYALSDGAGGALAPSPLIKRVCAMLNLTPETVLLQEPGRREEWKITRPRRSVSHLAGALQTSKETGALGGHWRDVYNWARDNAATRDVLQSALAGLFAEGGEDPLPQALAARLYAPRKKLKGSVTRFERFRACPFQHFAQYGLKLAERAEYRFAAPDLGQFLHAALKRFGEKIAAEGREWKDVGTDEYKAICREIVEGLAPKLQNEILLSTAQHQHLLGRIRRTVERSVGRLIAFAKVSAFKPVGVEKSFGQGQALPPLSYALGGDYTLEIAGQIDRIDCFDDGGARYFLVIDYKSGQAYLNLIDLYYGLKMQLLTYLLVVQNSAQALLGSEAVPAGVLYYFLKNPLLSDKRRLTEKEAADKVDAMLRMPGWVLADVDMIRQIDSSFKFIKVSVTTKNEIHAASKNSVKTAEEFLLLLRYMDYLLTDTGKRILRGDINAAPYQLDGQEACTYCKFRPLCRFDGLLPGQTYRKLERLGTETVMAEIAALEQKDAGGEM